MQDWAKYKVEIITVTVKSNSRLECNWPVFFPVIPSDYYVVLSFFPPYFANAVYNKMQPTPKYMLIL